MNSLIDTVFFSEKRKAVLLLLLKNEIMTLDDIKSELNETSVSILPQIKILIDRKLVTQEDGKYKLSMLGKIITENVSPFVKNLSVLVKDSCFWSEHELSPIPDKLLKRIGDIGNFEIINVDLRSVYYEPNPIINNHIKNAESIKTFITYYAPEYAPAYYERLVAGAPISVITTNYIVDMAAKYRNEINDLLRRDNTELYICSADTKIAEVTVTDKILLLFFYSTSGNLDYSYLISCEPGAVAWGEEFFEYLKSRSGRKKEI
ncbi:winged helix-turn-helix domain-containing protein [Methanolapillus millepedarum]|uniref:Methanogenesis regulatory protein FilR1 middle domain-containing protein n=1 Tax=Methanolapillus millepedarum TaxID=3028296 RepID=A0AA96V330_9EURY|nr:hypothetical protein MsAc7_12160 [Methanosarcinaceae archaeon Ac7]